MDYRDRSLALTLIGVVLLLAGAYVALLGPIEMYCFYLFSAGGRFYYEGFGFGSFMFGNIAAQIIGYYAIAAVLIPLGCGHLAKRRWARALALALCWAWLVLGAPLTAVFFFVLAASKDLSLPAAVVALVLLALSYLILPGLSIRLYGGRNVRLTVEAHDPYSGVLDRLPVAVLVMAILDLFGVVVLHVPILFHGVVPLFGRFLSGMMGIALLDLAIWSLALLTWGTLRRRVWAWWGSLVGWGLATLSVLWTLIPARYADILAALQFPPREVEFLDGLPFEGYHFAVLIGLPMVLALAAIARARRHFRAGSPLDEGSERPLPGG